MASQQLNIRQVMADIAGSDEEKILLGLAATNGGVAMIDTLLDDKISSTPRWIIRQLKEVGLVTESYQGLMHITTAGREVASRVQRSLENGERRDEHIRRALLQAVSSGISVDTNKEIPTFLKESFPDISENDFLDAFNWCDRHELFGGFEHWGGKVAKTLTASGREWLKSDRLLLDSSVVAIGGATVTYTDNRGSISVSGNVSGGIQGGSHNVQNVTVTIGSDSTQLVELLTEAQKLASEVDAPETKKALADALDLAKDPSTERGRVRSLVDKALTAAAKALGTEAGQKLMTFLTVSILPLLPV
jgi:hypothetical protein